MKHKQCRKWMVNTRSKCWTKNDGQHKAICTRHMELMQTRLNCVCANQTDHWLLFHAKALFVVNYVKFHLTAFKNPYTIFKAHHTSVLSHILLQCLKYVVAQLILTNNYVVLGNIPTTPMEGWDYPQFNYSDIFWLFTCRLPSSQNVFMTCS